MVEFTLLSRLSRVRILPQKSSNFDTYRNFERSDLREDINAAEIVDGTLLLPPPPKKKKRFSKTYHSRLDLIDSLACPHSHHLLETKKNHTSELSNLDFCFTSGLSSTFSIPPV